MGGAGGDPGGQCHPDRVQRVPRSARGHPDPWCRSRDRRGRGRAQVGSRAPPPARTLPVPRCDLLLALPVALADTRDRRAEPRSDDLAGVGQRHVLLGAGVLATLTYYFFENPFRHSRYLARRRWASLLMGLCLIAATLAVTTYEENRTTVDLGILATVASGSICPSPPPSVVSHLKSTYAPSQAPGARESKRDRPSSWLEIRRPARFSGTPSSRAVLWNAVREWCRHRMWDRERPVAPNDAAGYNFTAYTAKCQGEANSAETQAIERYRPNLIVWGSTDETQPIEVAPPAGNKVLKPGSPTWKAVMLQRMNSRVGRFIATGARVILLLEPPGAQVENQPKRPPTASSPMRR